MRRKYLFVVCDYGASFAVEKDGGYDSFFATQVCSMCDGRCNSHIYMEANLIGALILGQENEIGRNKQHNRQREETDTPF